MKPTVLDIVIKHGGEDGSQNGYELWEFPSVKQCKEAYREIQRSYPELYDRASNIIVRKP